ncbi:MAG: hypothetical protein V5A55_11130, partial [Halovenus sp.]
MDDLPQSALLRNVSLADFLPDGLTGIDASGFERTHGPAHYTKRTNLTIQQLQTTLLDGELHHQRNMNGTANAALEQKF